MRFTTPFKRTPRSLKNKITLFAFIVLPFTTFSQTEKYSHIYDSDEIISKGVELYQSEKYSEAIKEYDKILKPDSDYLKAQYEKILALSALEKEEELQQLFEKLYSNGSMKEYPDLFVLYGSFLSDKQQFAQAEKILLEAEKQLPYSSIVSYNTAVVYIRMEDRQKAIDYLKKTITNNPNYASAHYILGLIAYESGRIVEGSLGMLGYLTLAPAGKFSTEAVLKLNTKMGQDFLKKDNLVYSAKGDDFSELELILRNQLPLNQKYKVITTIDDIVTRQMQAILEYAPTHQVKDGFFENIYIPYLADIQKKKLTEDFIYYSLISFEEKLGKKLTTHKKKIIDFSQKYVGGDMWELYGRRKLDHFGVMEDVVIYLEDNFPSMIGKTIDGKAQGKYKLVNKHGQLLGEINYKDNELEGLQTYYYPNGKKSNSVYFVKGVKSGEFKEYYTNGNIQSEGTYKNGEPDGSYIFYYPNGGKQCERTFKNGQIEGASICYYPNGQVKNEYPYVNGKLNGKVIEYNEIGAITQVGTYVDDLFDGEVIVYYDGTKVNSKLTYQKGIPVGSYMQYYENGQIYKESTFENGNIKKSTEYFANGKIIGESFFDAKGQLEKQIYYDENGVKYFEERFKGGKTKVGYQYTASNNQPIEVPLKKDMYEMKDLNGTLRISGYYSKGTMNGPWTYYKSNGNINFIQNYKNDKVEGLRYDYDEQGQVSSTYYQSEGGVISGLFEGFRNNKMSVQMYFSEGERHGPFQYFYKNGGVSYEGYYINGRYHLNHYTYTQSGKPLKEYEYIDNYLVRIKSYNSDSSVGYEVNLANKTQKVELIENQGLVITSNEYKNGVRNGNSTTKLKSGELVAKMEVINDVIHGKYQFYHATGKLSVEADYYSGKINGTSKYYDLNGKMRLSTVEAFDKEFGNVTRYYENGQKIYEYNSFNEVKDGEQIFYNHSGKPIAAIGYAMDVIQYYKVLDKAGNLGEVQKTIPTADYQIVSKYPDGKTAFKLNLTKGLFDKQLEINSESGQPIYVSEFKLGLLHGKRIEYFKNGKIYKSEFLDNNHYQGVQEYFSEDGKIIISAPFNFDELHGELKVFENGKLVKHRMYDSNELVEIKL